MRRFIFLLSLAIFLLPNALQGAHLVGGEIYYEYLGNNEYKITMIVYRDCFPGGPQKADEFDSPANMAVYHGDGSFEATLHPIFVEDSISTFLTFPCVEEPPTCIKRATYETTVTLPPSETGYTIVWQRFARGENIDNLFIPGDQGMTLRADIPPQDNKNSHRNSSPRFDQTPPILICGGQPLEHGEQEGIDQSATDADGDSLAYEFCAPLNYNNSDGVHPPTPNPPPYNTVNYSGSFSSTNPIPSNPALEINDTTGVITGTPNQDGIYVVGICVKEYREGELIATHMRDFHFVVQTCPRLAYVVPLTDTMVLCRPFEVDFEADATNAVSVEWDFGDPTTTEDTSTSFNPTYSYPSTGTYEVTLYALNEEGCKDTAYADAVIRNAVRPNFDYITACPGEPVQFNSTSESEAGAITDYQWVFPNGDTLTGNSPTYTFQGSGTKSVELTIFTSDNCSETVTKQVSFHPLPNANFSNELVCQDQPVQFSDQSNVGGGNAITGWEWDFDDGGATSTNENPQYTYADSGTYEVQLIVTTNNGCVDTTSQEIFVGPHVEAEAASDTATCNDVAIELNASGGNSYQWSPASSLDDPTSANPMASPSSPTTYKVLVSDECSTDSAFVDVAIHPNPTPEFDYTPACANEPIQFDDQSANNIEGWEWDFGDGSTATTEDPSYNFEDNGPHQVTLNVTNNFGCDSAITQEVIPYELPPVQYHTIQPACLLKPAVFIDATEMERDSIIGWNWDLGDGTTGTTDTITNTYQNTGNYPVTLVVETDQGCIDSLTKTYIVPNKVVGHAQGDTTICPNDKAPVEASGGVFYKWTPEASVTDDTIANPDVFPLEATTYSVVISDTCYKDTAHVSIDVHPIPDPDFTVDLNCADSAIGFNDISTTGPTDSVESWEWHLGGMDTLMGNPLEYTFDSIGPFDVSMHVVNNFGCDTNITREVAPYPIPSSDFAIDTIPCPYEAVPFTNQSTITSGTIDQYEWDFGDGNSSTADDPDHVFGVPDTYNVVLTSISDQGCEDTTEAQVAFDPYVEATASEDPTICEQDTAELWASGGLYYSWKPESGNIFSPNDSITQVMPNVTTTYEVMVSDECYTDSAEVTVTVESLPEYSLSEDTSIYLGDLARLTINGAPDVDSVRWKPTRLLAQNENPNDSVVMAQPDTSSNVYVFVKNEAGCNTTDTVFIEILEGFVTIPNAFTPNGDGLNDNFFLITNGDATVKVFRIYSRWGELMYSYQGHVDATDGWDGTFRGKPQDPGTYTYVYEVVTDDASEQTYRGKGNVTLIR